MEPPHLSFLEQMQWMSANISASERFERRTIELSYEVHLAAIRETNPRTVAEALDALFGRPTGMAAASSVESVLKIENGALILNLVEAMIQRGGVWREAAVSVLMSTPARRPSDNMAKILGDAVQARDNSFKRAMVIVDYLMTLPNAIAPENVPQGTYLSNMIQSLLRQMIVGGVARETAHESRQVVRDVIAAVPSNSPNFSDVLLALAMSKRPDALPILLSHATNEQNSVRVRMEAAQGLAQFPNYRSALLVARSLVMDRNLDAGIRGEATQIFSRSLELSGQGRLRADPIVSSVVQDFFTQSGAANPDIYLQQRALMLASLSGEPWAVSMFIAGLRSQNSEVRYVALWKSAERIEFATNTEIGQEIYRLAASDAQNRDVANQAIHSRGYVRGQACRALFAGSR